MSGSVLRDILSLPENRRIFRTGYEQPESRLGFSAANKLRKSQRRASNCRRGSLRRVLVVKGSWPWQSRYLGCKNVKSPFA
jgi:hypothetical protein